MNYEILSMDTLDENKKLLGEVEKLRNERQELLDTIDMITNDASEYVKRIDKAIEYIGNYIEVEDAPINERIKIEFEVILDILRGDK